MTFLFYFAPFGYKKKEGPKTFPDICIRVRRACLRLARKNESL